MTPIQVATLRKFQELGIRYLLVGSQAMRARGIDRQTRDVDLWIARDQANAEAMIRFLERVQNRPPLDRLLLPNFKFTIGDPINPEVDILTSVAGDPDFERCIAASHSLQLDGQRVTVIASQDLLSIKEASAAIMDRDTEDESLSDKDRKSAAQTAAKERQDIALLKLLVLAGG